MAEAKQLVRAADHLIEPHADDQSGPDIGDFAHAPNREGLLLRLFGCTPRYGRPEIRALYQEVDQEDPLAVYDYCRSQGVEVLTDQGEPVPPWRDIAVMLKARAQGLDPSAPADNAA